MPQQFVKDPSDELDYKVDWSEWLAGSSPVDTIATSTWTVDAGITKDSDSNTTTDATIWLSGGTAGRTYHVTNRIVTAGGRTAERSIYIAVLQK